MEYSRIKEISCILVKRDLVKGPSAVIPGHILDAADRAALEEKLHRRDVAMDDAFAAFLSHVYDNLDYIAAKADLSLEDLQGFIESVVSMTRPKLAEDISG